MLLFNFDFSLFTLGFGLGFKYENLIQFKEQCFKNETVFPTFFGSTNFKGITVTVDGSSFLPTCMGSWAERIITN